jgi:hypothetical protein
LENNCSKIAGAVPSFPSLYAASAPVPWTAPILDVFDLLINGTSGPTIQRDIKDVFDQVSQTAT